MEDPAGECQMKAQVRPHLSDFAHRGNLNFIVSGALAPGAIPVSAEWPQERQHEQPMRNDGMGSGGVPPAVSSEQRRPLRVGGLAGSATARSG